MNSLEQRYRRALRMLPAAYRRVWEDEMVAAYLDRVADEDDGDRDAADFRADYGSPAWSEVASVASSVPPAARPSFICAGPCASSTPFPRSTSASSASWCFSWRWPPP